MRYIDADKLKRDLIDNRQFYPAIVKNAIEEIPTEDVVPRAEVEALEDERDRYKKYYFRHEYDKWEAEINQEVAKQIFEEIEQEAYKNEEGDLFLDLPDYLKVKKKYIGE